MGDFNRFSEFPHRGFGTKWDSFHLSQWQDAWFKTHSNG